MANPPMIVTAGEILVEFVSHTKNCGLETIGDYSGPYPSGAPAIFLDQAARMGGATQMVGGIGNDGFGRAVRTRLEQDGVGTDGITVNSGHSTGVAFVTYYDDGHRDFIFHLTGTAAERFDVSKNLFDPAHTYLHVSAASLGNKAMRKVIMELAEQVHGAGGKITCDPNARPELMQDASAANALADVVAQSYCLMPSTSDLGFLYPDLPEEAAIDTLLASKAEIIVLKRGAAGALVVGNGARFEFAGHPVREVDPTGAGDCFCGTFVSLVAQGLPLHEAGIRANAAGAIAVTRRGPMEGNSGPQEIEAFLNRQAAKDKP